MESKKSCQICDEPELDVIYDAKLKVGPWAWCCVHCFKDHCYGLGIGLGQKFIWVVDKYIKEAL